MRQFHCFCYNNDLMGQHSFSIDRVGTPGGEAWLIRGKRSAVLVDTGFLFYAQTMAAELKGLLEGIPLSAVLVTHSHYDHAGGLAKIKEAFPDAITVAAAHTARILKREGALKAMRALNRKAAEMTGFITADSGAGVGMANADLGVGLADSGAGVGMANADFGAAANVDLGVGVGVAEMTGFITADSGAGVGVANADAGATSAAANVDVAGAGVDVADEDVGGYEIDLVAGEGDTIQTADFVIEVWETHGHTNDSLSFVFQNEGLIALSETTGIFLKQSKQLGQPWQPGRLKQPEQPWQSEQPRQPELFAEPAFIVSWKAALAALDRIEKVKPNTLIFPHTGVLAGDDIPVFLRKQREEILFMKDLILRLAADGKTEDEILVALTSRYYDRRLQAQKVFQPVGALMLNLKAMIPRVLKYGAKNEM